MNKSRKAFTLIELLIAVTILSIMIIFLYKSYATLNHSNKIYKQELKEIISHKTKKKVIFLDFSLKISKDIRILNQDRTEDVVFFQSSHSIHKRYNPYIAYIAKNSKLYRLESLKEFKGYPLSSENIFDVDYFGEINSFRVYQSKQSKTPTTDNKSGESNVTIAKITNVNSYLIHIDFKKEDDILYKIVPLNN